MQCPECGAEMEHDLTLEIDDGDYFGSAGHRTKDWGDQWSCEICGFIGQWQSGSRYYDYEVVKHGSEEVAG